MSIYDNKRKKSSLNRIRSYKAKQQGQALSAIALYDHPSAVLAEKARIDIVLVGDSLGMAVYGREDTLSVTMDEILTCTKAVCLGIKDSFVVADMPFMSYQASIRDAVVNAGKLVVDGNAQAVKLEGGVERYETIKAIVSAGIPVMGHIGIKPQSIHEFEVYRLVGRKEEEQKRILEDALAVEKAGAFGVVLELVEESFSSQITDKLSIPTIGIGSGKYVDGQIQVWNDLHRLSKFTPKHAYEYSEKNPDLNQTMLENLQRYRDHVSKNYKTS